MAVRNFPAQHVAVFGIYASNVDAECGAADLISAGFASQDISVLLSDAGGSHAFAHQTAGKASAGTSAGATAGGLLGGALGILAGTGALVIPGIGPLVAAGPIAAGLAGLGAQGTVGALVGALSGLGIPEHEAMRYEGRVVEGGTLLAVHCESPMRVKRAMQVFNSSGADLVASSLESRSERIELALI